MAAQMNDTRSVVIWSQGENLNLSLIFPLKGANLPS
jgi:hypothetical protein